MEKNDKHIISDEYLVNFIDANNRNLDITLRVYIWGNPEGKNIKPRIQIEVITSTGIIWDEIFDVVPMTIKDINEIELATINHTYGNKNTSVTIGLWDNGCQKHINRFNHDKMEFGKIFRDIQSDSYQASKWIAKQVCSDIYGN